jgi:hypothetical protein
MLVIIFVSACMVVACHVIFLFIRKKKDYIFSLLNFLVYLLRKIREHKGHHRYFITTHCRPLSVIGSESVWIKSMGMSNTVLKLSLMENASDIRSDSSEYKITKEISQLTDLTVCKTQMI